jgi:hypothetical protein
VLRALRHAGSESPGARARVPSDHSLVPAHKKKLHIYDTNCDMYVRGGRVSADCDVLRGNLAE